MLDIGQKMGRFLIEQELGSGAMGTVYRARYLDDKNNSRTVALKIIALGLSGNETALARFEREADILKQLKHPNIVRLFASGRYKGTPFFAMEFIKGESVDHTLARKGRLEWRDVVQIGIQIASALQHAHERGIIHRDLKPSNLMILEDGTAKLTDFGIAKDADLTALTGANCTVGTAAYMSPEQCRGEAHLTAKSDLYALGVVFFELLTGRKPFIAESPVDMFMKHVNDPPPRPSRIVMEIPSRLDTMVLQLLEKKAEHRPMDAAMVAKVLEEIRDKEEGGQSAGAEAATARAGDRRVQTSLPDEQDREAARALRSVLGKRKIKKKSTPIFRTVGFSIVGVLAVLGGAGAVVWILTRPPSPDDLYKRAERFMQSEENYPKALAQLNGKDGPVREFLRRYPDHPQAKQVTEWRDKAESHDLIERLRINATKPRVVRAYPEKIDGNYESHAFLAMRFEEFGDVHKAGYHWKAAELLTGKDGELRIARRLAEMRFAQMTETWTKEVEKDSALPKDPLAAVLAYRKALLERKLDEAKKLKKDLRTKDAEAIVQQIDELYKEEKDKEIVDLVKQAGELSGKKSSDEKK